MTATVAVLASMLSGMVFAASTTGWQCAALILVLCITGMPKSVTAACVFSFYSLASLPVVEAVYSYNGNYGTAVYSYALLVLINVSIVGIAALQNKIPKWISIPIAFIVLSVPPLSSINPLSIAPLAGWLFPSTGAFGIAALIGLVAGLSARNRIRIPISFLAVVAGVSSASVYASGEPSVDHIQGISIVRNNPDIDLKYALRTAYRYEELMLVSESSAEIVILPESIFGEWNLADGLIYSQSKASVFGGARKYLNEYEYINVVVNAKTGTVIYEQVNPPVLPLKNGVRAVKGRGKTVNSGLSVLICYEATNPWLAVQAFSRPEPVVWVANLSWSNSHYLEFRINSALVAWSRLYKTKAHTAVLQHA